MISENILNNSEFQISPRYTIIPENEEKVWFYQANQQAYILNHKGDFLFPILNYLKKGTTKEELKSAREAKDNNWSKEVSEIITSLNESNLLHPYSNYKQFLNEKDYERFRKQIEYFSKHEDENHSRYDLLGKLRKTHVLLVGLGSFGSAILPHLCAAGVHQITGVDMDIVEENNFTRAPLFGHEDIGIDKVEIARNYVGRHEDYTKYNGFNRKISSSKDLNEILDKVDKVDLIILTADSPQWEISLWIAQTSIERNVPMIRGNRLGVGPLTIPDESACPACEWPRAEDKFKNARERIQLMKKIGNPSSGALSTNIGSAASILANEVIHFLSGLKVNTINKRLKVDFSGVPSITHEDFLKDERCPVCGTNTSNKQEV